MHKFDKIIMEGMVNTESMLKARVKVLKKKRDAGFDVKAELQRANRFVARYSSFVQDWMYWYYDTRNDETRSGNPADPPALPGIFDGVEIRMKQKFPELVLPRAHEIELVIDTHTENRR